MNLKYQNLRHTETLKAPIALPLVFDVSHSYRLPAALSILLMVNVEVTRDENSLLYSVAWLIAMSPPGDTVTPLCFQIIGVGNGLPMKVHSNSKILVSLTWVTAGMIVSKTGLTKQDKNSEMIIKSLRKSCIKRNKQFVQWRIDQIHRRKHASS